MMPPPTHKVPLIVSDFLISCLMDSKPMTRSAQFPLISFRMRVYYTTFYLKIKSSAFIVGAVGKVGGRIFK